MKKKWIWIGSGIVALCAIIIIIVMAIPDKQNKSTAAVQNTTKVSKGNITVSVSGSGSVVSTDGETVRTKDEGKASEVLVEAGDVVKKGQVLLTFEAEDNEDSLKSQETTLQTQKLDLADLQEEYKQQVQEGASEETLNATKKSITKQELNISNTESEIASLKEDMVPPDPLTSPIDGTVTTVNITSGERAQDGDELFVINNYQNLSVTIQVDELDIPDVELGMKANVQIDALPDQTIEGEVSDIADEGVTSNGVSLFDVTIDLKNSDNIRVGMSAEATIILDEKQDVLTLPIEAVQQSGDKYIVTLPTNQASGNADSSGTDNDKAPTDTSKASAESGESAAQSSAAQSSAAPSQDTGNKGQDSKAAGGVNGQIKEVEVGVHDESTIEIVSGLNEGDEVVIPTVVGSSSTTSEQEEQMMQQGGGNFGGGMPAGGGGFSGGGAPGGGGGR